MIRHGKSETIIMTPNDWHPQGVCDTRDGDLLVSMVTSDFSSYKIVRYDGKTTEVKQEIETDDNGDDIFTGGKYQIFMTENINEDICASDRNSKAVISVDKLGKVRFQYNGKPSGIKKTFTPKQIASDSIGQVIVADYKNDCLHIVDQNGQFVRLVDNTGLERPTGLSLDKEGRLWVSLYYTGEIKVIQYKK
jgi:streptogramin lyase